MNFFTFILTLFFLALFKANSTYFWRLTIFNQADPTKKMASYLCMNKSKGPFGYSTFTTPPSLSPTSPSSTPTITRILNHTDSTGLTFFYCTLDDVDPSSPNTPCEVDKVLSLPSGWVFAPNTAATRLHVAVIARPWGGANLVLADGSRVDSSGSFIDGYPTFKTLPFSPTCRVRAFSIPDA
jgi:hypothetical protein